LNRKPPQRQAQCSLWPFSPLLALSHCTRKATNSLFSQHVIKTYPALHFPSIAVLICHTICMHQIHYRFSLVLEALCKLKPTLSLPPSFRKAPWQSKCLSHHFMVRHFFAFAYTVLLAQDTLSPYFLKPSRFFQAHFVSNIVN